MTNRPSVAIEQLLNWPRLPRLQFALSSHLSFRWRRTRLDVSVEQKAKDTQAGLIFAEHMRTNLKQKGVTGRQADSAIQDALNVAADQQLFKAKWRQRRRDREGSVEARKRLIRELDRLVWYISKVPKRTQSKLNALVAAHDIRAFDAEMFVSLLVALAKVLETLPPKAASKAYQVIYKPVTFETPEIVRYARSELIDWWESMPPEIRFEVEAEVRLAKHPRGLLDYLRRLVEILRKHPPTSDFNRALTTNAIWCFAWIWRGVGLRAGAQYDDYNHRERESRFQRFAHAALLAFGDRTRISRHQISRLNR